MFVAQNPIDSVLALAARVLFHATPESDSAVPVCCHWAFQTLLTRPGTVSEPLHCTGSLFGFTTVTPAQYPPFHLLWTT
ncbi:hypothetical protein ASC87_14955 [Rhizobacter sp. Root1221]|nr:hypothetical protein ASC87_14955 [Rhizobacter sp. Root1221]